LRVPKRLSAVRARGSREAGRRSRGVKFAPDSPLEESGFELPVPLLLVTGSTSFAAVRFLLGVAEAGFFPGILLYFTYWFPSRHHARIVSGFLIGLPIAVAGGAPISTALLGLEGWLGLHGWQIMYIAEAVPTLLIGVVTLFLLTDRPEQARFLSIEEKSWLAAKLQAERKAKDAVRTFSL
jgi:MFS transporter, ACS family, tartrate transporter